MINLNADDWSISETLMGETVILFRPYGEITRISLGYPSFTEKMITLYTRRESAMMLFEHDGRVLDYRLIKDGVRVILE